ncbi:hypothetical protein ACFLTH_01960 [Bacteroidota bacterium]
MRKLILVTIFLFAAVSTQAQFINPKPNEGLLAGGLGVTWIDGAPYYSFHLFPEAAFGKFGVGFDLKLEYGSNGKIRTENFNEFSDYLSVIRYVRYGLKKDPFYVRLGALDFATLGHGSIMYLYNNSPSYDARKIGLAFDLDFGNFGFESVYSAFGEAGILGIRGYMRPMQYTIYKDIPIIGMLEVGATLASDFHDKAGVATGNYDEVDDKFTATVDDGAVTIFGLDLGLPLIRTMVFDLDFYIDYTKILGFGSGAATGFFANFKGLGLLDIKTRIERRFNGDNYIPSYFNPFYEIERFNLDKSDGSVTSKIQQLKAAGSVGNGYYGEMLATLLNTFYILGSFQKLDNDPDSGILHLSTEIAPEGFPYVARAGYDKVNIKDAADLFKTDDRSHLYAEVGYKPMPYILCSIVYHWTFTPIRDADNNVLEYKTQKKVEPRISFIYPINVGRP